MTIKMTHVTVKDADQISYYEIKAEGITVGTSRKIEGGKFSFEPVEGASEAVEACKTMRDLKEAVSKTVKLDFLSSNKKETPAKKKAEVSEEQEQMEREMIEAAVEGESEDIDLD